MNNNFDEYHEMIPEGQKYWETLYGNKWRKFTKARKTNVTRIKKIEICHMLRNRNRMLHKCNIRLWSFYWWNGKCDEIESVATGGELTLSRSDE